MMVELIALYKLLSLGLIYPDEHNWESIESMFKETEALFEGEILSELNLLKGFFCGHRPGIEDVQSEYLSIFDLGRDISPYETEYNPEKVSRKPFELADIAGFYKAFGFSFNEDMKNKESLDHISIELEFMAILSWKEEVAREMKQDKNVEIVRDARMKFVRDHLANWGFYYCRQIEGLKDCDFYKRLAKILKLVLTVECERYSLDVSVFDRKMSREPYTGVRGEELTC